MVTTAISGERMLRLRSILQATLELHFCHILMLQEDDDHLIVGWAVLPHKEDLDRVAEAWQNMKGNPHNVSHFRVRIEGEYMSGPRKEL